MTNLNEEQQILLNKILFEDKHGDRDLFNSLPENGKSTILNILNELSQKGFSSTLNTIWEIDYDSQPVDILEFMNNEYYLGKVFGPRLYRGWEKHLVNICNPENNYLEVMFTGAIGIGKTQVATALQLYDLYKVLCLRNPKSFYSLPPTSTIVFAIFNVSLSLVSGVGLQMWNDAVKESPYFNEIREYNPKSPNKIFFPKGIQTIVGSKFRHSLGYNVFSAFLDEANFGGAASMNGKSSEASKNHVYEAYNSLLRRMESRFMEIGGTVPGKLYLVSSKRGKGDFLDMHIKENKDKGNVYIVDEPIYKIKTHKYEEATNEQVPVYTGETFNVLIGDQVLDSRILNEGEKAPDGYRVEKVPVEHYESFEKDLENSIKDISGISLYSESSFILNRETFRKSFNFKRFNPLNVDDVVLPEDKTTRLLDFFDLQELKELAKNQAPRAIHIDIAISGDALGISSIAPGKQVTVKRKDHNLDYATSSEMQYFVDFLCRVVNEKGKQIQIFKIANFIIDLIELGLNIMHVSADGFQSVYLLQLLKAKGIQTKTVSVDRTDEAYLAWRLCHYENRINIPPVEKYVIEGMSLVHLIEKNKVDHPNQNIDGTKGSKDLTDSIVGALWVVSSEKIFFDWVNRPSGAQIDHMRDLLEDAVVEVEPIPENFKILNKKDIFKSDDKHGDINREIEDTDEEDGTDLY